MSFSAEDIEIFEEKKSKVNGNSGLQPSGVTAFINTLKEEADNDREKVLEKQEVLGGGFRRFDSAFKSFWD